MPDKKKLDEQEQSSDESLQDLKNKDQQKPEGSGIFTTDGKELPKIDGGYDITGGPGGTLGDNEFE
jgi:hypothetical protein